MGPALEPSQTQQSAAAAAGGGGRGSHRSPARLPSSRVLVMLPPNSSPALNGVLIGLLSSFGSVTLLAFIFLAVYFFRFTQSGRIFLDRIGRPGEYDDEQAFAREEAEALESMDDMSRTEYLRAKGMPLRHLLFLRSILLGGLLMQRPSASVYPCEPSRVRTD